MNLTDFYFKDSKSFDKNYNTIKKISMLEKPEVMAIVDMVKYANFIHGSIAEVGCNKCGTTYMIASSAIPDKDIFAFDSFNGLPFISDNDVSDYKDRLRRGDYFADYELAYKLMSKFENVTLVAGLFSDSFKEDYLDREYSFVFVDADLYESTKQAYEFFYPKLVSGGIIATHDYGFHLTPGVKKVVDDFFVDINSQDIFRISNILAIRKK